MIEKARALLAQEGPAAVIAYLNGSGEAKLAVEAYSQLIPKSYWEDKNLDAVMALATAGINFSTAAAANAETAPQFLGSAKTMAYNLASFTWPGWDEPGISVSQAQLVVGLEAAKTNLHLAKKLVRGDLPLGRAYWMLGAQYWASGQQEEAAAAFAESARYARLAEARNEELLAQGFAAAVASGERAEKLEAIKSELAGLKNGVGFVEQIEAALRVFGRG